MGLGAPSLNTTQKREPSGPPFVAASANNGLSVDTATGKIVLGNNIGDILAPAQLLSSREILVPAGLVLLLNDNAGNQLAAAAGAMDFIGTLARQTTLRPAVIRVITDITTPVNPMYQLLVTGGPFSCNIDLDFSNGFSALRFFRINPIQGITFDIDTVKIGVGVPVPSARLHTAAGVATPGGSPFKYDTGVIAQAIVENGAKNFDGSNESIAAGGVTYLIAKTLTATANLDFPNTLTLTSSDLTIAVAGAVLGDVVSIGVPNAAVLPNSCYTAWVSAANTVTVRFNNYSALPQDPAAGVFRASITKY